MYCPFCGAQDTKVVDSRLIEDGLRVRRRRSCLSCGERFTTLEMPDLTMPPIIKSDGRRENFQESKLRKGILRALEKRPVGLEQIDLAIARIKKLLASGGEREISARKIGELVMSELREIDEVAYVRFASVYLSFEDVSAFREAADKLEREDRK